MANVYLALDENLEILPVLNKIDLASARPDETREEIEEVIGLDASEAPLISAKEGIGIEELLEAIVKGIPAPSGNPDGKLKALIFDSKYDNYKGVIIYTRIFDGQVKKGDIIRLMNTKKKYEVTEVGVCAPNPVPTDILRAGQRLKLSTSDVLSGLKVQIHIFLRTVVGHENRPVVMVDSVKRLLTRIDIEA